MEGVFVRIQRIPTWNPHHKSRHPKDFERGKVYHHGEGEWIELPGMACFPTNPLRFARAIFGLETVIATKEEYPLLMDWDEEGIEEITDRELLLQGYHLFWFWGKKVGDLPDGVIAVPVPLTEEEAEKKLREYFTPHLEEIWGDEDIQEKFVKVFEVKKEDFPKELYFYPEWEDLGKGLLLHKKEEVLR